VKQNLRTQTKLDKEFTASHRQAGIQPSPAKPGYIMRHSDVGRQTL